MSEIVVQCNACGELDSRENIMSISRDSCRTCGHKSILKLYVAKDVLDR